MWEWTRRAGNAPRARKLQGSAGHEGTWSTRARGPVRHLDQEGTSGTQFSTLKSETNRNNNRERFNM